MREKEREWNREKEGKHLSKSIRINVLLSFQNLLFQYDFITLFTTKILYYDIYQPVNIIYIIRGPLYTQPSCLDQCCNTFG